MNLFSYEEQLKIDRRKGDDNRGSKSAGSFRDFHFERGKPFDSSQRMNHTNKNGRTYAGSSFYNFNPYGF